MSDIFDIDFGIETETSSIIKVIGVGGGGGNAVNQMYKLGIHNVDFVICNTDSQALKNSPITNRVQLGTSLTSGLGAGNNPQKGREAAIENITEIEEILDNNTKMVFITAGMGGGTGTGAAPVIAKAAKDRGILTVAVVSVPFQDEGPTRINQAIEGIKLLQDNVDSVLVINNERLHEMYKDLTMSEAFGKADEVLATATKGIAEIITVHGYINVDFEDVRTVMQNSGVALMGSATAEGEDRATEAIKEALNSPLLKDNDIKGARNILLNIMSSSGEHEIGMREFGIITSHLTDVVGSSTNIIWGTGFDDSLNEKIRVTIIATGFSAHEEFYELVQNYIHVPFGEKIPIPPKPITKELEIEDESPKETENLILNYPEDEEEQAKVVEFAIEADDFDDEPDLEDLSDFDLENINTDSNKFNHLRDLDKLNDSAYLDEIEQKPAYLRQNQNLSLNLDFDDEN